MGEAGESAGVVRPRHWEWRLVKQKTLTGAIIVRKWTTDEEPSFIAKQGSTELQTHLCPFHDCGKAFADAAGLRKHMHTHGEKQYICQVEVCCRASFACGPTSPPRCTTLLDVDPLCRS
mmetsp:Transcript_3579/g.6315  ORF Transcript_3579/g.6315 Transcript_3579/m.6315 type:complete len:119 (-) Transcript_3579:121-477(-)